MISQLFATRRRTLLLVGLSLGGILVTMRAERSTEARANRLHRGGSLDAAAAIYDDHALEDPTVARVRYNLGTTLLRLGNAAAFAELTAGSVTEDERLRVRALYNRGLWSLIQAIVVQSNDSALSHASDAVEANKAALRLDPLHVDAGWNLALAQRILVTAAPEEGPGNTDTMDGPTNIGERQLSDEMRIFEEEGIEEAPLQGDDETLAGDDLGPLSIIEASQIVGDGHLDPSTLIGKLLLRESRSRRRRGNFVTGPPW